MASSEEFVTYVCDAIRAAGDVTYRKMFGEYGIFCDGKFIGVVCDNCFFVKRTKQGAEVLPNLPQVPPYEGANPYFLLVVLEDQEKITAFLQASWEELPFRKKKKKKVGIKKEKGI